MVKVKFSPSTNKEKKYMAVFYSDSGEKIKTTHFGAKNYGDFTQDHDLKKREAYIERHKVNENWNDYMTAGALSRWILWEKSTISDAIKAYKKKFNLK